MIHPQYFIDNIGNKYLPHYERLNLMLFLSGESKIESVKCPSHIVRRFETTENEKYFTVEQTGHLFWKKTFYTLSQEGRVYLNHYKKKCEMVSANIRDYISKLEEIPSIENFIWVINDIINTRFVSVADYVTQSAILGGAFVRRQHVFESLLFMNHCLKRNIKQHYEDTMGVDISTYAAYQEQFEFFLLCSMIEFHKEDIFLEYFDSENKPEIEEIPTESGPKTNISINFRE